MMSHYMTEQEQLERIKKWWQKYSSLITLILTVILLLVAGYKYWNQHQYKIISEASNAYEQMMSGFSNQDYKKVRSFANQIITAYPRTVYAQVAHLTLAKLEVTKENYAKAKNELALIAKESTGSVFNQIAKIRMARLFFVEKAYDKALLELDQIKNSPFNPVLNELKGDIYLAKGEKDKAFTSYKEAFTDLSQLKVNNFFLEMKMNELAPSSSWKEEIENPKLP